MVVLDRVMRARLTPTPPDTENAVSFRMPAACCAVLQATWHCARVISPTASTASVAAM